MTTQTLPTGAPRRPAGGANPWYPSDFAAAVARVLHWGRRREVCAMDPRLDDTACSVVTLYGPFRIRSYRVAMRVRAAFGGFLYQPQARSPQQQVRILRNQP
jgi:hypothetical protein